MKNNAFGLRLFLYGILELIKEQEKETCSFVEEKMSVGIATTLYNKYKNVFDKNSFEPDNCKAVDEYFNKLIGVADGQENKYICDEDDGLLLILKIALDEIF